MLKARLRLKSIIIAILLLTGLVFCHFIYTTTGFVPVIGSYLAAKEMSKYKQEPAIRTRYDIMNFQYISNFTDGSELKLRPHYKRIIDNNLSEEINKGFGEIYPELVKEFPENLTFPNSTFITTSVDISDHNMLFHLIYLLGVENKEEITKEESTKMPARIAMQFVEKLGKDFKVTGIQMLYSDQNGNYEIWMSHYTSEPISYEKLLANTKKIK
ncbi:hypothetical protein SDC9_73117 [bioreactor metagenome]|uniref:Uncharacterized protein n=1 Tax=bioreactor metagenome TaxID=1076179 RepID=A0A644YJE2_9ZZZZ